MFVEIADNDRLVSNVIEFAISRMISASFNPACPTTQPVRRNMITPRIVSTLGMNTPPKVPNFIGSEALLLADSISKPRTLSAHPLGRREISQKLSPARPGTNGARVPFPASAPATPAIHQTTDGHRSTIDRNSTPR